MRLTTVAVAATLALLAAEPAADAKMSRTSVSAVPFHTPRASVVSPASVPVAPFTGLWYER